MVSLLWNSSPNWPKTKQQPKTKNSAQWIASVCTQLSVPYCKHYVHILTKILTHYLLTCLFWSFNQLGVFFSGWSSKDKMAKWILWNWIPKPNQRHSTTHQNSWHWCVCECFTALFFQCWCQSVTPEKHVVHSSPSIWTVYLNFFSCQLIVSLFLWFCTVAVTVDQTNLSAEFSNIWAYLREYQHLW